MRKLGMIAFSIYHLLNTVFITLHHGRKLGKPQDAVDV